VNAIDKLSSYIEALRPILYIPIFDFHSNKLADTKPMSVSLKEKIESLKSTLDKLDVKSASRV